MANVDEGLLASLKKSSTSRLISELKLAQNALDADALRNLPRADVISYVYHLRQLAGQKTALKDIVPDFVIGNVIFFPDTDAEEGPLTPTPISAPVFTTDPGINALLVYLMNKEATDKAALEAKEAAAKEERRLERERLENKEAAERTRLENKEAAERTRLENKEAAERTRLAKEKADDKAARLIEQLRQEKVVADRMVEEQKQRVIDRTAYEKFNIDKVAEERQLAAEAKTEAETRRLTDAARFDNRIERAYKTLRGQISTMPNDSLGVTIYLKNLEDIFDRCNIDQDLRCHILRQNLNEKGRNAYDSMSFADKADFTACKQALLTSFQITPISCRNAFQQACKTAGESFSQFANRLRILLSSYLHSRNISDMGELIELLLTDRFKDSLTQQQRGHIGDQEQEKWFTLEKIATLVDFYVVNHPFIPNSSQSIHNRYVPNASGNRVNQNNWQKTNEPTYTGARSKLTCTVCSGIGHDATRCFKVIGYPNPNQSKTSTASREKQNFPSINKMAATKNFQGKSHNNNDGRTYRTRTVTIEEEQDHNEEIEEEGNLDMDDCNTDNNDVNQKFAHPIL